MLFRIFEFWNFVKMNNTRSITFPHFTNLILQNNYVWNKYLLHTKNVDPLVHFHIILMFDANTFVSSDHTLPKLIDNDFNILVLFFRLVEHKEHLYLDVSCIKIRLSWLLHVQKPHSYLKICYQLKAFFLQYPYHKLPFMPFS